MAKSKSSKPKEANWKAAAWLFVKIIVAAKLVFWFIETELQNPPQKVDAGTLVTDVVQGVKDIGNGLVELGRTPIYIGPHTVAPGGHPLGPSNRIIRCTYCNG